MKHIALGGDHAGFAYKERIKAFLKAKGYTVKDYGTFSADAADYPDFVHPVCDSIAAGESDAGILICGTGNGVAITANRHRKIRAALCWNLDLAALARQHNDANVLCLAARFVGYELANSMVERFLTEPFEGGRHQRRVDKISP